MVGAGDLGRVLYDCVARSWSGSLFCRWRRRALWNLAALLHVAWTLAFASALNPPLLHFATMYLGVWRCPLMHWCRLVQMASLAWRSCPLSTSRLWSHTVTWGRLAKRGCAARSRWPEGRLCQRCSEERCCNSCCNHYGHPCSCTGWLCWHLSCLGWCDLAPSTSRGAHEAVAGWFASHASKRPAGYRPSPVPCHRRERRWLCCALPV